MMLEATAHAPDEGLKMTGSIARILAVSSLLIVAACASGQRIYATTSDVLAARASREADPNWTIVFIPGALSPLELYDEAEAHFAGTADLRFVRLPGLNGRPLHPPLNLRAEGVQVARLVERSGADRVTLVGHSMGAAIAVEAAARLADPDRVDLVLISPMPEAAGGVHTAFAALGDLLHAVEGAGSFAPEEVWREYWKLQAYGRHSYARGARTDETDRLFADNRYRIARPTAPLRSAHLQTPRGWRVPEGFRRQGYDVAIYHGAADPVFSVGQIARLAGRLGADRLRTYPGQGHLLPITEPDLYRDVGSDLAD